MKAIWHHKVLAETENTIVIEGNHYFPAESVHREFFRHSNTHTICSWKGEASYYDIVVDDAVNHDAAWYYPDPKKAAEPIKGRVAFWRGVVVE